LKAVESVLSADLRIDAPKKYRSRYPFIDMHNRMKEALVLLGNLPRAVVRPPLVKISDAETARIRNALIEAGRLDSRTALGRNAA
jgi:4-hydroxy-tetrahydrodipicolinate synthase